MTQGQKIMNLAKTTGKKALGIAKFIKWSKSGFSRKVNSSQRFDSETLEKIAAYLGVTAQYLQDESRPHEIGDPIPEDALVQPLIKTERQEDSPVFSALAILAEREMEYRTASNAKINPDAMIAAQEELAQEMRVLSTELRLLREEMARSREEDEGNHDADF